MTDFFRDDDPTLDGIRASHASVETIPLADATAISASAALVRIDKSLALLEEHAARQAAAAERQADTLETLVALFASCIGRSYAWCPGAKPDETPPVNFIRSSGDGAPFKCGGEATAYEAEDD
jgi:hypothetical protein